MSDPGTYDVQVQAIQAYNQPILDGFRAWLEQSDLAEKTVKSHVENIDFFTEYLQPTVAQVSVAFQEGHRCESDLRLPPG